MSHLCVRDATCNSISANPDLPSFQSELSRDATQFARHKHLLHISRWKRICEIRDDLKSHKWSASREISQSQPRLVEVSESICISTIVFICSEALREVTFPNSSLALAIQSRNLGFPHLAHHSLLSSPKMLLHSGRREINHAVSAFLFYKRTQVLRMRDGRRLRNVASRPRRLCVMSVCGGKPFTNSHLTAKQRFSQQLILSSALPSPSA